MATVVQKLENVINIYEDTRPAGEQILYTISTTAVAKPIHRDPLPDTVQFLSDDGEGTAAVILDGTLKVYDLGGSPVLWVGTIDDFVDKMNNEYLDNSVTLAGGGGGGDATAANQALQITEAQTTNTSLTAIDTVLDNIKLDTAKLDVNLSTVATEVTAASINTKLAGDVLTTTLVRRTDATGSPIAAGAKYVSFYNAGTMDATVLETVLKKGESIDFPTTMNDTLPAISYDATGTELVIQTIV